MHRQAKNHRPAPGGVPLLLHSSPSVSPRSLLIFIKTFPTSLLVSSCSSSLWLFPNLTVCVISHSSCRNQNYWSFRSSANYNSITACAVTSCVLCVSEMLNIMGVGYHFRSHTIQIPPSKEGNATI